MKKITAVFLLLLLCLIPASKAVFADSEVIVYDNYTMEISANKIYAPSILSENYKYTTKLYSFTDDDCVSPLCENFSVDGYTFSVCGKYFVKYFLTHKSTGENSERVVSLTITDTTAPQIKLNEVYPEYYEINDSVEFIQAVVIDNSGEQISYRVSVKYNGSAIDSEISGNKFKITKAGNYQIIYTAIDSSGNKGELTESFTVISDGEQTNQGKGCNSSFSADVYIILSVITGIFILGYKVKRYENNKKN